MNNLILGIMCVASFISPIQEKINALDKVRDSIVYEMSDGSVIVSVITEPIFTLSTRQKLYNDIEEIVSNSGVNGEVFISFDIDIFSKLSLTKDDNEASKIIETIKSRQRN